MPVSRPSALPATVVPSGEELTTGRQAESAAPRITAAAKRTISCIVHYPFDRRSFDFNSGETTAKTPVVNRALTRTPHYRAPRPSMGQVVQLQRRYIRVPIENLQSPILHRVMGIWDGK